MQILKQYLELQLSEYDHLHGRVKLAKIVTKINQYSSLNDLMELAANRGDVIPPQVFNAALHEKLFFILGNNQRLNAGICYCYLLFIRYLQEVNKNMNPETELLILEKIKGEINSTKF